jgi:hypothetical protein
MEQEALLTESADVLYELVEDDIQGDYERFRTILSELCDTGILELLKLTDDMFAYKARTGLTWSDIVVLSDPIKKKIILQLIQNPKCFFVLFNTQKGKLRIIGREIASWSNLPNKRVVSFLVVSNDRTLSEQSTNGLFSCFPVKEGMESSTDPSEKYNVRIFELSSNNKTPLSDIITYIDAYAYNPNYPMPLVVILANKHQIKKLIEILVHIKNHPCAQLCAGGGWDEADQTYPPFRTVNFTIRGNDVNFLQLLNDPGERIIRNGFVTATEGGLMGEEFDECANAVHYTPDTDPVDCENYFAYHHDDCRKHYIDVHPREPNNLIAQRVLDTHWDTHFKNPILLQDSTPYMHKVIINADVTSEDMKQFAQNQIHRANVITFNMRGVTLFTLNCHMGKVYSARKKNLNQLLFYIYKMNQLDKKPLLVIGRRKVDRGLGFHYAPRANRTPTLKIDGIDGELITDGIEGLIWTDMIMGNKIENKHTAVQKAGRGAGIIRQCPQYSGQFHYWIDKETSREIERQYKRNDGIEKLGGSNSILQAITRVEATIPNIQQNHTVDLSTFRVLRGSTPNDTLNLMKQIINDIFKGRYRKPDQDASGKYKTSLNTESDVVDVLKAIKRIRGAYGTNNGAKTKRRFLPSYLNLVDETSLCCVIPLIDPSYTTEMKARLDELYGSKFITIPQEGPLPL